MKAAPLLAAFFFLFASVLSGYATPPSTPITVSVSLSRAPASSESVNVTVTVTSVLDAPGTLVEMVVPPGVTAAPANWTVDLTANLPATFSSSLLIQTSGNLTVSARAVRPAGSGTVWGDMKSIPLTVRPPTLGPSQFGWTVSEVPVAALVTPGNAIIRSRAPTPFAFTPTPAQAPSLQPRVVPSRTPSVPTSVMPPPPAGNVTLTGTWFYEDRNSVQQPIDQQLIEIRRGDGSALSPQVYCFTDTGGAYSCTFPDPGSTMRVWVRSWTNFNVPGGTNRLGVFSGIEVTGGCGSDAIDCSYPVQTPEVSCAGGATCDVGSWAVTVAASGEPYIGAHRMTQDLIGSWKTLFFDFKHGTGITAGPGRITYPVPSGHGTHAHVPPADGWISIEPPSQQSAHVVTHEYGHVVMANLWQGFSPNWPTSDCPSSHFIQSVSGPGCALSEGWGDFWSWYSTGDPVWKFPSGATVDLETRANKTFQSGDQVEGNVAAVLGDLFDFHNEGPATGPADRVSDGIQHVWHSTSQRGYLNFAAWWSGYWNLDGHPPCPALDILNFNSILYTVGGCNPGSLATHDFNFDNRSDILWRNGTSGQVVIWLLNGSSVIGGGSPGSVAGNWVIAGTGDFDGDGNSDILWRDNNTGQVVIWLMNGSVVQGGGNVGTVGGNWVVAGTGDFNADGNCDILWRDNNTGQVVIWLLNGSSVIGGGSPGSVSNSWAIVGTGDFNGDGRSDILWRDTTGNVVIWLINATTVIGGGSPGSAASPWIVAQTGDYNGDGKYDILWRNTASGQGVMWLMNGTSVSGGGSLGFVTTDWQIQGLNAD